MAELETKERTTGYVHAALGLRHSEGMAHYEKPLFWGHQS